MTFRGKMFTALAVLISLSCFLLLLLVRPGFQKASVDIAMEHQEIPEMLGGGWQVFYKYEWAAIETFMVEPTASIRIPLPIQDTYVMKVKARFAQIGQRLDILINGVSVGKLVAQKVHRAEKFHLTIPWRILHHGANVVAFRQSEPVLPVAFEQITFRNFLWAHPSGFLLTWWSSPQGAVRWPQWFALIGIWAAITVAMVLINWCLSRVLKIPFNQVLLLDLFSYPPVICLMGLLLTLSLVSPYRWVIASEGTLVLICLTAVGLSKVYLLGVVSKRYAKLVEQTVARHQVDPHPPYRIAYAAIYTSSSRDQSLLVSLGVLGVFLAIDARHHWRRYWRRCCRRLHWWGRFQPGNQWLLGFLGLWFLAAFVLILLHLPQLSEQIVNLSAVLLLAAVVSKGYARLVASHGK